ncbi:MAG TPA: isochorismatase family protein [Steroidobacteraceae bacterium]|nr:isochorismatase family protein [Steroidobacteraceae bacterium]
MGKSLGKHLGLRDGDALVIVDAQRDFLPGGSLPVDGADEVIAPLNSYLEAFRARGLPIFLTRDWHPPGHCSFQSAGGRWPPHCIQGTTGAGWAAGLHIPPTAHIISKGTDRNVEAYSGFADTALAKLLRGLHVQRLFVGGLTTDHCVHDTVLDARLHGFDAVILGDAIRAVDAGPDDGTRAIADMIAHGAQLHMRS